MLLFNSLNTHFIPLQWQWFNLQRKLIKNDIVVIKLTGQHSDCFTPTSIILVI